MIQADADAITFSPKKMRMLIAADHPELLKTLLDLNSRLTQDQTENSKREREAITFSIALILSITDQANSFFSTAESIFGVEIMKHAEN